MKVLGVQAGDFSAYYDLVQMLRAEGLAFEPLSPGDPVPAHVGVVILTDPGAQVEHGNVVRFSTPERTLSEALRLLHGPAAFRRVVVGIDPGERPGVAILGDGRVLRLVHASAPESVRGIVTEALETLPAAQAIVRVGNGAPTFRDRILQTLAGMRVRLELVDETRSTPVGMHGNAERDTAAATHIAFTPGFPLLASDVRPVVPTPGELRDIQRKSRMASRGHLTISRALARHVALGHLTLDQAVDRQRQKA